MSRPALPSLWAAAGALALHWVLLSGLGDGPPQPGRVGGSAAMLTRQIVIAPPGPEIVVPAAAPATPPRQRPRAPPPHPQAAKPSAPAEPPIAATPAAAFVWHYELRQGEASGEASLSWMPEGSHYQARLERTLAGRTLPGWRSQGRLDAQGLAPDRFAQQRGGRDSRATNFRREQGLISFSASPALLPLPAGVQDRLSWMLQLAARVAADAGLHRPGAELELPVVGLSGEVQAWRFVVQQGADLSLPIGMISSTLHLRRHAQAPYDSDVEVWLDPARHYLPVRLRHSVGESQGWELRLQEELPLP